SAAIVPNTSELLPEPETPVNTVSRRLGLSMLTSLRLFTRAPCTRIRSWRSAACGVDCDSFPVIVSPSVACGRPRRLAFTPDYHDPAESPPSAGRGWHPT